MINILGNLTPGNLYHISIYRFHHWYSKPLSKVCKDTKRQSIEPLNRQLLHGSWSQEVKKFHTELASSQELLPSENVTYKIRKGGWIGS